MGYRCPVCSDPQADDVHLANHLAFTALVRGGDHEAWLDEHVPDWGDMGEHDLAERVRELAESTEYPAVFEDTTNGALSEGTGSPSGHTHDHGHAHEDADDHRHGHEDADDHGHAHEDADASQSVGGQDRPEMVEPPFETGLDEEARAAIEQARELTRKRRANAAEDDPDESAAGDNSDESAAEGEQ